MEDESRTDISLASFLSSVEHTSDCLQTAAISLLQWNQAADEATPTHLSTFDLNHDFVLLNLSKLAGVEYNRFSFTSYQLDFNLQLEGSGLRAKLIHDVLFVKKHLSTPANNYPLHTHAQATTGLCSDVDKLVISLHHDSSSLLPHAGPYLMEHYLYHKSRVLFPYAQDPRHPVLMIDNYVNLGPEVHAAFVRSARQQQVQQVQQQSYCHHEGDREDNHLVSAKILKQESALSNVLCGGLVLYLCEGRVSGKELQRLSFVPGAALCLVTRDCKSLVREVARLDLEERWKFRLRDEYQTACADQLRPLFFLTGRFEN